MGKVIDLPKLWGTNQGFKMRSEERVHVARPAADVLFASAAQVFRREVAAVVLTGNGVDGASGVHAVKEAGGLAIAQAESTSAYFSMPRAAIRTGLVDPVTPLERIGGARD